jgi:transitional endoplasmic reticulum ATPase
MVFKDKEKYIKYIDNWVSNIPTYYKRGVPAKLSILMYGKPGTGKSSFYKALAKYLDIQDVCCISASYFTDPGNNNLRFGSKYAYPVVYALDDIDCVCNSRKNDKSLKNSQIVSSLLEFLDNPPGCYYKASDGVFYPVSIIVATTNYYDDLDEAVKRYGRFDLQIEMTDFDANEAEEMCHLYDLALSDIIHEKIKDDFTISPAKLQALCVENIDSHLKEMKTEV